MPSSQRTHIRQESKARPTRADTSISPASSLHRRALAWAARLGHPKTYDAHYLALAEEMKCDLLTADRRHHHDTSRTR